MQCANDILIGMESLFFINNKHISICQYAIIPLCCKETKKEEEGEYASHCIACGKASSAKSSHTAKQCVFYFYFLFCSILAYCQKICVCRILEKSNK